MTKSRAVCAAAFLLAVLLCFSACSGSPAALEYNGEVITEGEFQYYLATYKARFARMYSDFEDNAAFYAQSFADTTAEDFLFSSVVENVSLSLICDALFREYGLKLSSSVTDAVDSYLDSYLEDYAGGNRNVLNQALSVYGINSRMLREIYLRDERSTALFNYLYGEGGAIGLNDEDRAAYLEANYVRVRHIFVNDKFTYAFDASGEPVYGDDGYQNMVPLTGEALDAKRELIDAIDASLAAGDDFEAVYAACSEDQYYEHGYYLTRDMDFIDEVVSAAFTLGIGEWTKVESEYGTHYIKRLDYEAAPWADEDSADFFEDFDESVAAELFKALIEERLPDVIRHEDVLSRFSVEASPSNSRF